jgi:hypothetical protein
MGVGGWGLGVRGWGLGVGGWGLGVGFAVSGSVETFSRTGDGLRDASGGMYLGAT